MNGSSLDRAKLWQKECRDCGRYLSATEEHYYEYRCEDCERQDHARIQAWRDGVEDLELDERYRK